jgi:aryl-alcohol dehydrogenase-like predicted oxidoreductase
METRKIGSLDVTVCGLGTNNFGMRIDQEQTAAVVDAALEAGINFFDTADLYGGTKSEQFLGKALGARRDQVVIATKFGGPLDDNPEHRGGSARWVRQACEDSLRRLNTDRIDLYQLHFPDMTVPIDETLTALDELVKAGKVREIGNSNFTGEMIEEADDVSEKLGLSRFVSAQNMYSLLHREPEDEIIPASERRGLAVLPYFPLASGLLTGKYKKDQPLPEGARITSYPEKRRMDFMSDRAMEIVERLDEFARARDHTLLDLAMSWLLHKPVIASVIAGATKPEQVRANAGAVTWKPTDADLKEIDEITNPR